MYTVQVVLKALTAEMDLAFRGPILEILEFPFRIGRDSRERHGRPLPAGVIERRVGDAPRNNDLYIVETGNRLFVSRQHLMLEQREHGIYLLDLFSSCGTIVEGKYLGGYHKGGEIQLENGDVVVVGTSNSPYILKVIMV